MRAQEGSEALGWAQQQLLADAQAPSNLPFRATPRQTAASTHLEERSEVTLRMCAGSELRLA